jgi:ribosomal protein S18 acetylase RimI-like enzyme
MEIVRLTEATEQAIEDIKRLLPQLRGDSAEHTGSLADLKEMADDENVALIVAKDNGHIVGMGTLYMITKIGKRSGFIEDVVVDDAYRGQGLGQKIMQMLIDAARAGDLQQIYLTSRPERVAANKLYQKLGFEVRETNVYRLAL